MQQFQLKHSAAYDTMPVVNPSQQSGRVRPVLATHLAPERPVCMCFVRFAHKRATCSPKQ